MRRLMSVLVVCFIASCFSCGSSVSKASTAQADIPKLPWEQLPEDERQFYAAICPPATQLMSQVVTWPLFYFEDVDNPQDLGGGRFVAMRGDETAAAMIQYRIGEADKAVIEGALVYIADDQGFVSQYLLLDFYIMKALLDGEVTYEDSDDVIYGFATGEFFCLAQ